MRFRRGRLRNKIRLVLAHPGTVERSDDFLEQAWSRLATGTIYGPKP